MMAYNSNNLSVLAYDSGFSLWHYTTTDDFYSDIIKSGYFDAGRDCLRERDAIIVNCADVNCMLFVTENYGSAPVKVERGA